MTTDPKREALAAEVKRLSEVQADAWHDYKEALRIDVAGCIASAANAHDRAETALHAAIDALCQTPQGEGLAEPVAWRYDRIGSVLNPHFMPAGKVADELRGLNPVLKACDNHINWEPLYLTAPSAGHGEGWVSVEDRLPDNDDDVLVWVTRSPWAKHPYAAVDSWSAQHEDPLSMGGPTIEIGHDWNENSEPGSVTHWQRIIPPAPKDNRHE